MNNNEQPIVSFGPEDEEHIGVERIQKIEAFIQQVEQFGMTTTEIDRLIVTFTALRERAIQEEKEAVAEAEEIAG